jgi:hypothetical protein
MEFELNDGQFKGYLTNLLQRGVVEVNFTKVDGTPRKLTCTLQESVLPEAKEDAKPRAESQEALRVWDISINEWRSFRLDSINSVFKDGEQIWSNA